MSRGFTVPIKFGADGCQASFGNKICQETQTLDIIKEFNRVYESKLHEIGGIAGGDNLQAKVQLQQNWIRDLQQQNEMLVRAVEELEKEAVDRVVLLEERLENTSVTGAKVMQKYRDYNFSNNLIQTFQRLALLENDVRNLLEFINRARNDNKWNYDGLHFKTFNPSSILIHKCECTTCQCAPQAITDGSAVPAKVSTTNSHEKANNEIAVLDSQLKEMERKLLESPKTSDIEDLNFKLHLKEEELSSVKRSMLEVQSSLVAEVAEKNDEIITLRRDMSKLEEECRQVSMQFQSKDNMIEELQNEIIRLREKLKQLDKSKSVVIPLAEQDNAVLSLRSDLNKMEKEYNEVIERCAYKDDVIDTLQFKQLDNEKSVVIALAEKDDVIFSLRSNLMKLETEYNEEIKQCAYKDDVIKELRNELHQLKREASKFEIVKTIGKQSNIQIQSKTSQRSKTPLQSDSFGGHKFPQRLNSPRSPKSQPNVKPSQYLSSLKQSTVTVKSNSRSRPKTPPASKKRTESKLSQNKKSVERSQSRPQRSKSRPGFSSSPPQRSKSSERPKSRPGFDAPPQKSNSPSRCKSRPGFCSVRQTSNSPRRRSNSPPQKSKCRPESKSQKSKSPQISNVLRGSKSLTRNKSPNNLKMVKVDKSVTAPYMFLYEGNLTQISLNPKENCSNNDFNSSTDSYFDAACVNPEPVRCLCDVPVSPTCTLTANQILHEYYAITDSAGNHGVIKNFKEIRKVNVLDVPGRIPIKTYINNLELNIKTDKESLKNAKKKN